MTPPLYAQELWDILLAEVEHYKLAKLASQQLVPRSAAPPSCTISGVDYY